MFSAALDCRVQMRSFSCDRSTRGDVLVYPTNGRALSAFMRAGPGEWRLKTGLERFQFFAVDLIVLCVRYGRNTDVPITMVLRYVMSENGKEALIKTFCRPFVCGRYALFVGCLAQNTAHTIAENLLTNCVSSLVWRYVGMRQKMLKWSMKRFAVRVPVVLDAETAHNNLE